MELPQRYDPLEEESGIQDKWEKEKVYAFDPKNESEIFSVDTPPPTVSGAMHIGHAFSYSQTDFIVRYQRMRGKSIFYPFGTDDNGLATERLIEREKKVRSKKMDRDEFVKLCLDTLKEIRPEFVGDWKRLGISCDFSVFYSTIDDHSRKISQQSFIDLYKQDRIYKKKAPIIFCPLCKTAIAQVEMEDVEKKTTLNYFKAKVETGEYIIYATTRPELHPGCVGVSLDKEGTYVIVETNGEEWIISKEAVETLGKEFPMSVKKELKGEELIGRKVDIPLAQAPVSITHDISAKTEYGTGVVYYCSYGGLDCVEWMARHPTVDPVHIMDESGKYNDLTPFAGKTSAEARKFVLEQLEESGALIKKESMKHFVNTHERCGTDIEYIATEQWFIKYLDLKDTFLAAGKELHWFPEHMRVRYDNWVNGLQWDWCISRQRHFGVPIPVWYGKNGEIILPEEDQLPVDPLKDKPKGHADATPEKDVLDTWATSSMTPQLAVDHFKGQDVYERLFPMTLRPQAHDIITFWLFNTVVKSQLHYEKNPWTNVAISGFALDPHGRKMSKSKGNVVHPQEVIGKYGADALRFWAAGAKLGEDLPYQEKDIITGKKTITKLWNASKFVIMNLEDFDGFNAVHKDLELMDRWLLSKFNNLAERSMKCFDNNEYSKVKFDIEQFFWKDFCDNYLEIVKGRLYEPKDPLQKASAQFALSHVLNGILHVFAPFMPYVTEKIYAMLPFKNKASSIHLSSWPDFRKEWHDEEAEIIGQDILAIVENVRRYKSENQISMGAPVKSLHVVTKHDMTLAENDLLSVTKAEEFSHEHGEFSVKVE